MTKGRRKSFIIFSLLMCVSFLALGGWQIQRMEWKNRLIEQSRAAVTATPVSINDVTAGIEYGYDVDWLRITLKGTYHHDLERYIYMPTKLGLGYQVITPFIDESGFIVFIDRGWVPVNAKNPQARKGARQPANSISITGITRAHSSGLKLFLADADVPNKTWYWYDRETLANSLPTGLGKTADGQLPIISPVFVQLEPNGEPGAGDLPKIGPVRVDLPNNHLQYAITWFALGAITIAMLFVFLRSEKAKRSEI